jgi:C-terminal processing protease CtpA/Prc
MKNLPIDDSHATDQEIIKELKKSNFGFINFDRIGKNIAYLRLDGFKDLKYARKTAIEYLQKLADSKIIILDLRENHGGHSNMVHFISSYFFADKKQLNSLYFTEKDSMATAWTDPGVPGAKLLKQKLFLLTSKNTASAAESFAYSMKHYQRATVIGESTRGAAHWTESFQHPEIGIFLEIPVARPINPVTNQDWEKVGVKPDVECPAEEALTMAKELAIRG